MVYLTNEFLKKARASFLSNLEKIAFENVSLINSWKEIFESKNCFYLIFSYFKLRKFISLSLILFFIVNYSYQMEYFISNTRFCTKLKMVMD